MFAYCLNNPANGSDPCGTCFHRWDFWNDCAKCGGATIGDKWNNYITVTTNAYMQQAEMEFQVNSYYVKAVQNAISASQNAYDVRNKLEEDVQRHQYEMVSGFIKDRFSTPGKAAATLDFLAFLSSSAATVCATIGGNPVTLTMGPVTICAPAGAIIFGAITFVLEAASKTVALLE